ncbi:hypothetical protein BU24DRAFT_54944 [Aaosphaeria arxii CBS 175.79]|uniref:Uncharacterized protein n=1 Tax=Aaosphaeria arxii CBS 175.79 TaxID=1450172 RepID=A0A6A5XBP9_9PLEO|nr:uncharacterized protein BU24DRAFT_54944 [Aaosphaeria arxii CBS 175.79]KAF2010276.1 hypothetical protein BU24DRAFT_54944 [Aaosphaeria arxii CBS 175.79]
MPALHLPSNSPGLSLPASPRPMRQTLPSLKTDLVDNETASSPAQEKGYAATSNSNRPRRQDSLIFMNATIPLSPTSPLSENNHGPYDGLVPRKRSGLARLFCCFGREESARRRAMRSMDFEKVGERQHWTEY